MYIYIYISIILIILTKYVQLCRLADFCNSFFIAHLSLAIPTISSLSSLCTVVMCAAFIYIYARKHEYHIFCMYVYIKIACKFSRVCDFFYIFFYIIIMYIYMSNIFNEPCLLFDIHASSRVHIIV